MALIEEGPHGAEERVRAAVVLAHVEDLECEVQEEDFIRCQENDQKVVSDRKLFRPKYSAEYLTEYSAETE